MNVFDSRTPAPGVLVLSVPRPKINGMNYTQAKGMRRLDFDHSVMSAKPQVQPIKTSGGGLPPSIVVAKGDTRSKNHRRRSPKMRPQNRCFGGDIPSMTATQIRLENEARAQVDRMRNIYRRVVRIANPRLDAAYEALRRSFFRSYREHFNMVRAMEAQVCSQNRVAA